MAIFDRCVLTFTNTNVEATNYQQFGIEFSSPALGDYQKVFAQIIAYAAAAGVTMASGTSIENLKWIGAGTNVGIFVPFPVAEYADLVADSGGSIVAMSAYGVDLVAPGFELCPLGTSIVVSEYTAIGGPAGRGRHFLPFTSTQNLTAGGLVDLATRTLVTEAYSDLILNPAGGSYSTAIAVNPVVGNSAGTTETAITNVKVQPVFSNLESRRR